VGGIWVIGVDADKHTNRAILPPIGADGAGLEERVVQAAQNGIYPPITPAVRVFPMPDKPGRALAVVKVDESIEAPHAIENRTRVYVRTESTTDPYELSDIDRIEYMLRRRQQPEQRREELIAGMVGRSWVPGARLRVVVAPMWPRGILLPIDDLVERIGVIQNTPGPHLALDEFRLIQSGVLSTGPDPTRPSFHFEADVHGVGFYEAPLRPNGRVKNIDSGKEIPFVYLDTLVRAPALMLNIAAVLLRGSLTNAMVRCELIDWTGVGFLHFTTTRFTDPGAVATKQNCIQTRVSTTVAATVDGLTDRRTDILTELMHQTLLAFNYRSPDLGAAVAAIINRDQ
jgi:hypothetical protein